MGFSGFFWRYENRADSPSSPDPGRFYKSRTPFIRYGHEYGG